MRSPRSPDVLGPRGRDGGVKEGQKLRILMAPVPGGQRLQPIRVIVASDASIDAVVALSDTGKYVSVDVRHGTDVADNPEDNGADTDTGGVTLYKSVYETALRNQIPRPIIEDLIRIYSYDVDFQRKVQPGDSFEVLYAGEDETPAADSRNDVLFASLTVGGEAKKFYRFQSPDDGIVDYYDESGKSAKKFLVRKPVADGIMRSGFGIRRHPILGYTKMHTGVDWAGPTGTPVYASGNGTIEKAGWESGYGKYIRIRHTNGYETAYGHMSAFARGMEEGQHVRQGQVIGFMGSTGLSTGSHLHYEILVNGRFVDPMRIKLPRGRVLEGVDADGLRAGTRTARRHHGAQTGARGHPLAVIAREGGRSSNRCRPFDRKSGSTGCPALRGARQFAVYAACASLPLKVRPCLPAETVTFSPSLMVPARIISASGSCTDFWITRLSGRAP